MKACSQITFFYYQDLAPIAKFYEEIMGFVIEIQKFLKPELSETFFLS